MLSKIETQRLDLRTITVQDSELILQLTNSQSWLKYIGNRNLKSLKDAEKYVLKILNTSTIQYWIIVLKESKKPIGIITFIKRDYLEFYDLGFALLSEFEGMGYAYEASNVILRSALTSQQYPEVLATTLPNNDSSIRLLGKLGMTYLRDIHVEESVLMLFSIKAITN